MLKYQKQNNLDKIEVCVIYLSNPEVTIHADKAFHRLRDPGPYVLSFSLWIFISRFNMVVKILFITSLFQLTEWLCHLPESTKHGWSVFPVRHTKHFHFSWSKTSTFTSTTRSARKLIFIQDSYDLPQKFRNLLTKFRKRGDGE